MEIANCTITNNTADLDGNNDGDGGGIANPSVSIYSGTVKMKNSILAGNNDGSIGTFAWYLPDLTGSLESGGYNLIGVNNGGTITGDTTGNLVSADPNSPIDPVLDTLKKDGYQTATHALLPGSPAINAGNPAGCTDWNNDAIVVDQRGEPRPQSVICDMGAYEAPDVCANGYLDTGEREIDCGGTCDPCSCGADPVKIVGGTTASTIDEGFGSAQSGGELQVLEYVFNPADVVLSSFTTKSVTIKGGYDCSFSDNDGFFSTVDGQLVIGQNTTVTIENIVIK